jgi:hypothetical protein
VYIKSIDNEYMIISLYVDDILVFGTSMNVVYSTKRFLASKFDMKDMSEASVILDIKIIRRDKSIMLT